MIIGIPKKKIGNDAWCYVSAQATFGGKTEDVWYSTEEEYEEFLVDDRLDAFVIPFLPYAMTHGEDIICEAPVTNRLLYQLNHYLIPLLTKHIEGFKPIKIVAKGTNVVLPCAKAVGTGWTGGVDSMYTVMKHRNIDNRHYQLTHLVIANCGTFESDDNSGLLRYALNKARNGFAKETRLKVVGIDSNIQGVLQEGYYSVGIFRLAAAILILQKLFSVFYHSGSNELGQLKFSKENCSEYEMLPLWMYETDTTHFYSAGSDKTRIQKIESLADFQLAHKYLHPCIYQKQDKNCGNCGKCSRTIGALYALGVLDKFSQVFDVDAFYNNMDDYLAEMILSSGSKYYKEIIDLLKDKGIYDKIVTENVKHKEAMLLRGRYSHNREKLQNDKNRKSISQDLR